MCVKMHGDVALRNHLTRGSCGNRGHSLARALALAGAHVRILPLSMFESDLEAAAGAFFSEVFERHATDAADAYALGLYIDFEDGDARRPAVTAGFNSQAGIDAALKRWPGIFQQRRVPADEEEARWDFAFWSHNHLACFVTPTRIRAARRRLSAGSASTDGGTRMRRNRALRSSARWP